jgi:hypothetical protein
LRANPGPPASQPLSPSFLKHADEQTVVAMAAVLDAVQRGRLAGTDFTNWGVLAAPRHLGRLTTVHALQRYAAEGAWGISPHLIPHRTLHALSGTISQALHIHGPNLGVGGGPDAAMEVMLVAAAFLAAEKLPALWVVMTGWYPEPIPEKAGQLPLDPTLNGHRLAPNCQALALALAPQPRLWQGLQLKIGFGEKTRPGTSNRVTPPPPLSLERLLQTLRGSNGATKGVWQLGPDAWMELKQMGAGMENRS